MEKIAAYVRSYRTVWAVHLSKFEYSSLKYEVDLMDRKLVTCEQRFNYSSSNPGSKIVAIKELQFDVGGNYLDILLQKWFIKL